jgi:beta-lactamase regulating signal transducer with metallopeptidase domain/effector-binding domain-containing protein
MNAWINDVARVWWQWMASMLWQASLLIVLISLIDWAVSKWIWPQVRYAVWLLVLLKLVVPPTWSSPISVISWAEPSVRRLWMPKVHTEPSASVESPSLFGSSADQKKYSEKNERASSFPGAFGLVGGFSSKETNAGLSAKAWAFTIWIAGMLVFMSLLILKMARLRRWHRQQRERQIPEWFHGLLIETSRTLHLKRIPAIVFAKDAVTPAVYGMFRPVLLLPHGYLKRLSREQAEHVLLHELCHLKRGDLWLHGLYLVLHVAYWFNPLMIWTRRQMKHVREICCDLSVAAVLRGKTWRYRRTLLDTARELLTENVEPGLGLLGVFEEPFRLVTRLRWLEKDSWKHRRWILSVSLVAGLSMAAVTIPMSGMDEPLVPDNPAVFTGSSTGTAAQVMESEIPEFHIVLKRTESLTAVILSKVGSLDSQFEPAMAELKDQMKKQRIKSEGAFFFRIWTDIGKVPVTRAVWEVGCPVKRNVSVKPPLDNVRLPVFQVAGAEFRGVPPSESLWKAFTERVQNMGLAPCFPPAMEVFKSEGGSKPFWWNMELRMQAFQPQAGYPGLNVQIRETGPATALVLPVQGSYGQRQEAVDRLKKVIRKNHIKIKNRWFCTYYSDPSKVAPAEYLWDVGCELESSTILKVDPPFQLRSLEKDSIAFAVFNYPPDTEFPYMALIFTSLMKGWMISGPVGQAWSEDPNQGLRKIKETEWFIPVKSVGEFAGNMEAFGKAVSIVSETSRSDSKDSDFSRKNETNGTETGLPDSTKENPGRSNSSWMERISGFFKHFSGSAELQPLYKVEKSNPFWAILLPATGSMAQQPVVFEKLQNYMRVNGIQTAGTPFTRQFYGNDETVQEFELLWDAGYPVSDSVAVRPPFRCIRIQARDVVKIHYVKGMDEKALNVQLAAWLYHNNYRTPFPNLLIWTNGIYRPGQEIERIEIEVTVEKLKDPFPEVSVFTLSAKDRQELLLPITGSTKQEDEAVRKLKQFVEKNGIETLGDVFIQYHTSPEITLEKDMKWDVGVPVRGDVKVSDPYRIEWRPGRQWACAFYEGDHLNIPIPFWMSYVLNFTMNGYRATGYPRKIFRERLDEDKWKVELQWAVNN